MVDLINHPFPQLRRDEWESLNGQWDFAFDDSDKGLQMGWSAGIPGVEARSITVPFVYQAELSGIHETRFHSVVWYQRLLRIPEGSARAKHRVLHFEGVDYQCSLWINGQHVGEHVGGNARFSFDITAYLNDGDNVVVLRVTDSLTDMKIPRGKQYWKEKAEIMWFTQMTGIWRDVWMEATPRTFIEDVRITPYIDDEEIEVELWISSSSYIASTSVPVQSVELSTVVEFDGEIVTEICSTVKGGHTKFRIGIDDFNDHGLGHWWSPEHPSLYDLTLSLSEVFSDTSRKVSNPDVVHSYFGMRKVAVTNGKFCLNNKPYFLQMVLDQGYFKESILTPPSFEGLERDVTLTKELGFNCVRKHMMSCEARYAYLCDYYGLLVWGEMAAAYDYSERYAYAMVDEWKEVVKAGYNHPSIAAWIPLNESWGVPEIYYSTKQQAHANSLYDIAKSVDNTRPVVSNDGWEHCKSDLFTVHDYSADPAVLAHRYMSVDQIVHDMPGLEGRKFLFCPGYEYKGQPVMCTEMGGVNYRLNGLGDPVEPRFETEEEFVNQLRTIMEIYYASPLIQGVCYTQLTDTETEICGLLTWNRELKAPAKVLRKIFDKSFKEG